MDRVNPWPRLAGLLLAVMLAVTPASAARAGDAAAAAASLPLFVVIYRPGPAWKPGLPVGRQALGGHAAYMARLAAEGRSLAAGPLLDTDGGLMVLRAADKDAALRLVSADPALTSGVFVVDLHPWQPVFGSGEPIPLRRPPAR